MPSTTATSGAVMKHANHSITATLDLLHGGRRKSKIYFLDTPVGTSKTVILNLFLMVLLLMLAPIFITRRLFLILILVL